MLSILAPVAAPAARADVSSAITSAFNASRSGHLTCSELYGGLSWLGLQLSAEQVQGIVRAVDRYA